MNVYVAEIEGLAVAAINDESVDMAQSYFESEPFRSDLMVLEHDGRPLWNGEDEICVRQAIPDEVATFVATQARALKECGSDDDEAQIVVFLVDVTDPTDVKDVELPINSTNRALAKQALLCTNCQFEKAEFVISKGAELIAKALNKIIDTLPEEVAPQWAMEQLAMELIQREPQLVEWMDIQSAEMQARLMLAKVVE